MLGYDALAASRTVDDAVRQHVRVVLGRGADLPGALVVGELGKNYSGTGLDPNVIGRQRVETMPDLPPPGTSAPPLPDVREIEGWIYSSLPLEPVALPEAILLRRLRQTVDPDGNMSEELNEIELAMFSAETLEEEGRAAGLQPSGRRQIPPTEAHVGSTVVLFEKAG